MQAARCPGRVSIHAAPRRACAALLLALVWPSGPAPADAVDGRPAAAGGSVLAQLWRDRNDPYGFDRARERRKEAAEREAERRRLLEEGRRRRAAEEEAAEERMRAEEAERARRGEEAMPADRLRRAGSPPPDRLRRTCTALYREAMVAAKEGRAEASAAARGRAGDAGCTRSEMVRVFAPFDDAADRGALAEFDVDRYLRSIGMDPEPDKPETGAAAAPAQ